jgi:hypothetical protein
MEVTIIKVKIDDIFGDERDSRKAGKILFLNLDSGFKVICPLVIYLFCASKLFTLQ